MASAANQVIKTWPIWKWQTHLGIEKNVTYATNTISRNFMPYLIGACDIYAAPSRLEGFGMPQVEAGACGKPVIGIKAMGMLDTLVHGETGISGKCCQENCCEPGNAW